MLESVLVKNRALEKRMINSIIKHLLVTALANMQFVQPKRRMVIFVVVYIQLIVTYFSRVVVKTN